MHLRQQVKEPIAGAALTLPILESSFDIHKKFSGVAFNTTSATIVGGFAFQIQPKWILWGQLNSSGIITVLNIKRAKHAVVHDITEQIGEFL